MAENSNKKQTIMEAVRLAYENSKKINGYEGDDSSKHLKANKVSYSPEDTAYITSSCTDVNQAINIIDSYVKNGLDTANLKITGISYVNGITKIGEHASFDNNSTSIFGVRFTGDATVFSSGVTVNGGLSVSGSSVFGGSVGLPYGTTVKGPGGQTANLWDKISSAAAPTAQNVYGVTKDSDTVTREIDPADGKLKFTAKGGKLDIVKVTYDIVNSKVTADVANKPDGTYVGDIILKIDDTEINLGTKIGLIEIGSLVDIDSGSTIRTLSGYGYLNGLTFFHGVGATTDTTIDITGDTLAYIPTQYTVNGLVKIKSDGTLGSVKLPDLRHGDVFLVYDATAGNYDWRPVSSVNTGEFDPTSDNPASQKSIHTAIQTAINSAILKALNTAV